MARPVSQSILEYSILLDLASAVGPILGEQRGDYLQSGQRSRLQNDDGEAQLGWEALIIGQVDAGRDVRNGSHIHVCIVNFAGPTKILTRMSAILKKADLRVRRRGFGPSGGLLAKFGDGSF